MAVIALIHAMGASGVAAVRAADTVSAESSSGACASDATHHGDADVPATPGGQAPCGGCDVDCLSMPGCTTPVFETAATVEVMRRDKATSAATVLHGFSTRTLAPDRPPPKA